MYKNYRFMNAIIKRKINTYIFPAIFLIIFSILIIIKSLSNTMDNGVLLRLGFYYYLIPFACCVLYSAIKALEIFKGQSNNGMELIISAKPFKRYQIIFAKFLSLYTWLAFYSIMTFITIFLISFVDKPSTIEDKLIFAGSLSVGSFIIMLLISSIVSLTSLIMPYMATIFIAGVICLSPMVTSLLAPKLHAQHLKFVGTPRYTITKENIKNKKVDGTQFFFFNPTGIKTAQVLNPDLYKRMNTSYTNHKNSPYKYVSYFDIYGQLGSFLSMFKQQQWSYESVANWTKEKKKIKSDYTFTIKGGKYFYMYWNNSKHNELTASQVYDISKKASKYVVDHSNEKQWQQFQKNDFLEMAKNKDWINLLNSYIPKTKNINNKFDDNLTKLSLLFSQKENLNFNKITTKPQWTDLMYIKGLWREGKEIDVFTPKRYIPLKLIIIIWSVITVFLAAISIIVYYKKDFK